jgi:hypothetical protein
MAKATGSIPPKLDWEETAVVRHLNAMARPGKSDAEVYRLEDEFKAECEQIFKRPVRSFDDLVLLAAVAVHWNSNDAPAAGGQPYPAWVINRRPGKVG